MLNLIYELFKLSFYLGLAGVFIIAVAQSIYIISKATAFFLVFVISCMARLWEVFHGKSASSV